MPATKKVTFASKDTMETLQRHWNSCRRWLDIVFLRPLQQQPDEQLATRARRLALVLVFAVPVAAVVAVAGSIAYVMQNGLVLSVLINSFLLVLYAALLTGYYVSTRTKWFAEFGLFFATSSMGVSWVGSLGFVLTTEQTVTYYIVFVFLFHSATLSVLCIFSCVKPLYAVLCLVVFVVFNAALYACVTLVTGQYSLSAPFAMGVFIVVLAYSFNVSHDDYCSLKRELALMQDMLDSQETNVLLIRHGKVFKVSKKLGGLKQVHEHGAFAALKDSSSVVLGGNLRAERIARGGGTDIVRLTGLPALDRGSPVPMTSTAAAQAATSGLATEEAGAVEDVATVSTATAARLRTTAEETEAAAAAARAVLGGDVELQEIHLQGTTGCSVASQSLGGFTDLSEAEEDTQSRSWSYFVSRQQVDDMLHMAGSPSSTHDPSCLHEVSED